MSETPNLPRLVGINHVALEVVAYADIQFSKAPQVLRAMQLDSAKSDKAKKELADKGIGPR